MSYVALDKPKEAAADFDEAARADPQNGQIWITRGLAYERLGDKTKATDSYGHAINIRPRNEAAAALRVSAATPTRAPKRSGLIRAGLRQDRVEHRFRYRQHIFGNIGVSRRRRRRLYRLRPQIERRRHRNVGRRRRAARIVGRSGSRIRRVLGRSGR